jgi:hypothetical protein
MQFLKSNIEEEWMDLVNEFPEFILELSPMVLEWCEKHENKEELCNLRYSFECGIGWKAIIWEYFNNIRNLINKAKEGGDEVYYKTCIFKEKYGELRDQGDFYGPDSEKYYRAYSALSSDLMTTSGSICEKCGAPGSRRGGGWASTLCDEHCNIHLR